MPSEWLQVLAHPTTKDKAGLLLRLQHEMTIDEVLDLIEYQQYENWMSYEEYVKAKKEQK